MQKLTATEIIEKLKEYGLSVYDFAHEDIPYLKEDEEKFDEFRKNYKGDIWYGNTPEFGELIRQGKINRDNKLGLTWEQVSQEGGEGQGDHWESVKYFPDHDVYLKVTGYYQSYEGTSFDNWEFSVKEVKPVEKTITVYEKVN